MHRKCFNNEHPIPNELSKSFNTVKGRRRLIELYGDLNASYVGDNEDSEQVTVSFSKDGGIVLRTYQSNGWVRVNYYDKEGCASGETFDGRWENTENTNYTEGAM